MALLLQDRQTQSFELKANVGHARQRLPIASSGEHPSEDCDDIVEVVIVCQTQNQVDIHSNARIISAFHALTIISNGVGEAHRGPQSSRTWTVVEM